MSQPGRGRWVAVLAVAFGTCALGGFTQGAESEKTTSAASSAQVSYHVVHGWPVLPDNIMLDEVSAVAVDSADNVFVLTRAGRKWPESGGLDESPIAAPTVFVFDGSSGRLLTSWGKGVFALPHGITVDHLGNVWVADVALHQVFELSHEGKLLLTLGERGKVGSDRSHFNRPSGVAVANDGSIYVSDGYGNNRVVKYSPDGVFVAEWGTKGKLPGEFDLPHAIALDAGGHVYVLDRGNARVQVFDGNGHFLAQWAGPPFVNPQAIALDVSGAAYVTDAGNDTPPDRSGILMLRPDGSLIQRIGRFGNYDGQFLDPHGIVVGRNGDVYVADFTGRRVQKFVRSKE
jgi:peptidylamidoglycolate lyase